MKDKILLDIFLLEGDFCEKDCEIQKEEVEQIKKLNIYKIECTDCEFNLVCGKGTGV